MQHHVVIAALPYVDAPHAPMAAPAVLKASLNLQNISSVAMDLNIEVYNKVNAHPLKSQIEDFFYLDSVHDTAVPVLSQILHYCANKILSNNPTVIALSVLTWQCQPFNTWLCVLLKQLSPSCRIIIGGPGIKNSVSDQLCTYAETLKQAKLIDAFITGDGDVSLIKYLEGEESYPGINSTHWIPVDIDSLPYPDYSDYNFFLYTQDFIPIVDSKGCVRNCEFCDVIEFWEKFQYRSAENIFKEMLFQIEKYNMHAFDFRSSLSNGNLKEWKKLLHLMHDYNKSTYYDSQKIRWIAQFIVRPKSQHPEYMWQQMGETNGTLALGIESVIPHVRQGLGKHFSNEDIDYHLEMAQKYNVDLTLLMITGYPTETLDDYKTTKQWFIDRKHYNKIVKKVALTHTHILPGTGLERKSKELELTLDGPNKMIDWYSKKTGINREQREQHYQELVDVCKNECGFNLGEY